MYVPYTVHKTPYTRLLYQGLEFTDLIFPYFHICVYLDYILYLIILNKCILRCLMSSFK